MDIKWIQTTRSEPFRNMNYEGSQDKQSDTAAVLTDLKDQTIQGFGGCFNELGWIALQKLPPEKQNEILDLLFDGKEDGLALNFCRMPIGASDYADEWYSHNETEGDFEMNNFSIERDRKYLLPYIREAKKRVTDLKLFASPWSPPTWMKHPRAYNFGTLVWEKENLAAYALYLAKFIEAYAAEDIEISQLHIQNEPMADQKFPSCKWTGEKFAEFIGKYLGPVYEERKLSAEIWLGTLNGPDMFDYVSYMKTGYNHYANLVLHDPDASKYVKGVGYQWSGKFAIQQTHKSFPEIGLMQTENECGDGSNSWEYAQYVFDLFRHYLSGGANAYTYWNMVLEEGGESTWGWKQNTMISVLSDQRSYRINPEFYVMKHFSRFIQKGAVRGEVTGHWASNTTAFTNPDGSIVFVLNNPLQRNMTVQIQAEGESYSFELAPDSMHTILLLK